MSLINIHIFFVRFKILIVIFFFEMKFLFSTKKRFWINKIDECVLLSNIDFSSTLLTDVSFEFAKMSSVAPDKILEIKQLISNHLSQSDINNAIRDVLTDYSQRHPNSGPISRDALIRELKNRGLVDSMMHNIQFGTQQSQQQHPSPRQRQSLTTTKPTVNTVDTDQLYSVPLEQVNFDANRRHLYLQFLNGKAFTGNNKILIVEIKPRFCSK